MMTALQIEDRKKGCLSFLRRNRIRVEHRYCDSATIKCVTYEHHRGRVNWASVDRFVKAQRNRVLCAPSLELPADSGYKRFVSCELSRRMCENAALYLLRCGRHKGVRVVLIDDSGDSVGLCGDLAEYCDPVVVMTSAVEIYTAQSEALLNERGAALRICRNRNCLRDADLIIAPDLLTETLPCSGQALILTGEKPQAQQNAEAVYDYYFDLPAKFKELCPPFLDEMYFASALYTMGRARELGAEVFTRCGDGETIHSRGSLAQKLKNRMMSRTNS